MQESDTAGAARPPKEEDAMDAELEARFTYHAPGPEQLIHYSAIRSQALDFAIELQARCPQSRELSIALTHLDSVVMFANAAIARRSGKVGGHAKTSA